MVKLAAYKSALINQKICAIANTSAIIKGVSPLVLVPELFFYTRSIGDWQSDKDIGDTVASKGDSAMLHKKINRPTVVTAPGVKQESIRSVAQIIANFHLFDYGNEESLVTDCGNTSSVPNKGGSRELRLREGELKTNIDNETLHNWSPETAFLEPQPSFAPAPESIYALFPNDLNILKIHEAVCAKFAHLFYLAPTMREQAEFLHKKALEPLRKMSVVERAALLKKANTIMEKAISIENRSMWHSYCNEARPWLEMYAPLASDEAKGFIHIGNADLDEDTNFYYLRLRVIQEYTEIAKKYINLSVFHLTNEVSKCPVCGACSMETSSPSDDHGMLICECGREAVGIIRSATSR